MKSILSLRPAQSAMRLNSKRNRAVLLAGIALAIQATAAPAAPVAPTGRVADVPHFDIDGVRLHMSGNEAIAALRKKFGNDVPMDIEHTVTQQSPKTRRVDSIEIVSGHYTLDISFVDAMPVSKDVPEQVSAISLHLNRDTPNLQYQSRQIEGDFYEGIVSKYGAPTGWTQTDTSVWCERKSQISYLMPYPCDGQFTYMSYKGADLTLADEQLEARVHQYYVEHLPRTVARPPL